ncbi:winged helix-turn-helix domain-containing protein [Streptomyces populi]|uniref:winged helix-turn-helix domain-containing protein n=1 Tax=Streptomyces populi TaxID=2058924 RepID=UPI0035DB4ECA
MGCPSAPPPHRLPARTRHHGYDPNAAHRRDAPRAIRRRVPRPSGVRAPWRCAVRTRRRIDCSMSAVWRLMRRHGWSRRCPARRAVGVREHAAAHDRLTIVQLPSCATDLNPVQGAWSPSRRGPPADVALAGTRPAPGGTRHHPEGISNGWDPPNAGPSSGGRNP